MVYVPTKARGGSHDPHRVHVSQGHARHRSAPLPASRVLTGITVNCICPGPTATELYVAANPPDSPRTKGALAAIPVGRIGRPEDMAHAIAFFLDEQSAFVTGQALIVCGGSSLGNRESLAPA